MGNIVLLAASELREEEERGRAKQAWSDRTSYGIMSDEAWETLFRDVRRANNDRDFRFRPP